MILTTAAISTVLHTLSLHDALPISADPGRPAGREPQPAARAHPWRLLRVERRRIGHERSDLHGGLRSFPIGRRSRSEEHTSELQSQFCVVWCLPAEKIHDFHHLHFM